jgi:hypothetical protein
VTLPAVGKVTVPTKFKTDGGSIPRMLWPVTGHPIDRRRYPAYIVHDWLYDDQPVSRQQADEALYEMLTRELDVAEWRASVVYYAVRAFGWVGWRRRGV